MDVQMGGRRTGTATVVEPAPAAALPPNERGRIAEALRRFDWHRDKTARHLGITRRTLFNKIKKYGLESIDNSHA